MARVKVTSKNISSKIVDWKNNVGTTRDDILVFIKGDIEPSDWQNNAWENEMIIEVTDDSVSPFMNLRFIEVLSK